MEKKQEDIRVHDSAFSRLNVIKGKLMFVILKIDRHVHRLIQTAMDSGPVTTPTIPYIRGTPETIARILQPYNIRVAHKPITTLRRLLTNVKDKDKPEDRQGAVYKIKCCDCQASYIGETGKT